ncbi:hypothetical protein TcYC6_0011160 [Trypanosoma cruzi]|nr:hypothetical protein TcYC6_0011160 [Trypanosoma cruzi]RNC58537.1 hypothetical protein TcCL_ESM03799 [Trypanosoma cruzi]
MHRKAPHRASGILAGGEVPDPEKAAANTCESGHRACHGQLPGILGLREPQPVTSTPQECGPTGQHATKVLQGKAKSPTGDRSPGDAGHLAVVPGPIAPYCRGKPAVSDASFTTGVVGAGRKTSQAASGPDTPCRGEFVAPRGRKERAAARRAVHQFIR